MERNEELLLDPACYALAFRLLRTNGYEVLEGEFYKLDFSIDVFVRKIRLNNSAYPFLVLKYHTDALVEFEQEEEVSPQAKDINCILELYRDSEITIFQNEPVLDEIHNWTTSSMKKKLLAGAVQNKTNEVTCMLFKPSPAIA